MKERDYEGMSKEDYDKFNAYCDENGFKRTNDDFSKTTWDDEGVFSQISIVTWANYDVHPTMYAVGVSITVGENGERGLFFDSMTVNRFVSSFDEFIEFVGKSNKLKQMYKEFFKK